VDVVLDGGPTTGGLPSTVLDLTVSPPVVLRVGAVAL
jgi:L-threonylcarbamoyladenylate synthase